MTNHAHITADDRRARLGLRHGLAEPLSDVVEIAQNLVAIHSSDPATVYLTARARVENFTVPDMEKALYSHKSLVRVHGMRRTLWVVSREDLGMIQFSSTDHIAARERKRMARMLEEGGVTENGDQWIRENADSVETYLSENGPTLTRELTADLEGLRDKIVQRKKDGTIAGQTGAGSRLLVQLGFEARLIRTEPTGTWNSSQYRWTTMNDWLGSRVASLPREEAQATLLSRWLEAFGPATETDVAWWTGWTLGSVRQALERVGAVTVTLANSDEGYVLPEDLEPVLSTGPWVAFLPSLDVTTMGWKERDWYLGEYASLLFDRNGNAGPTVWANGRIVGGWSQRSTGEVVYELLADVGNELEDLIASEAGRLQEWLGDTVIKARFRSPHDKQLSA